MGPAVGRSGQALVAPVSVAAAPATCRFVVASVDLSGVLVTADGVEATEQLGPEGWGIVDLEGSVDLDGPLSLSVVVRTPREGLEIKEVRDEVLDLMTTEEGWVAIPFQVAGTVEEPSVRPDARALAAVGRSGAGKLLQEKATEGIKSLFRRKRD